MTMENSQSMSSQRKDSSEENGETPKDVHKKSESVYSKQNQTSWEKIRNEQTKRNGTQTDQTEVAISEPITNSENQKKARHSKQWKQEFTQTQTNCKGDPCCIFENIKIKCYERCQRIINDNGSSIERVVEIVSDIGGKA